MQKMIKVFEQFFKFGIVGVICFIIDYGLMIALTELAGVPYLISCGISFSVSVVVNYILSMRYVFSSKKDADRKKEFALFVLLSISGLLLTELLMWLFAAGLGINYMIAKIITTGIVMIYNFITRKLLLEERTPQRNEGTDSEDK